jgi:hypothetical protein
MRGFLAIFLILSYVPFIYAELGISNELRENMESIKSDIVLHQMINEDTYAFEMNTTRTISQLLKLASIEDNNYAKEIFICEYLDLLGLRSAIISKVNFTINRYASCIELLNVNNNWVELAGKINLDDGLLGYVFYREFDRAGLEYVAILPEGTVIE